MSTTSPEAKSSAIFETGYSDLVQSRTPPADQSTALPAEPPYFNERARYSIYQVSKSLQNKPYDWQLDDSHGESFRVELYESMVNCYRTSKIASFCSAFVLGLAIGGFEAPSTQRSYAVLASGVLALGNCVTAKRAHRKAITLNNLSQNE